ncbi:hypothetical protein, partial [Methyloversatilis sp.]|uniref:hypothetical protein n=1 Tax=Methyloversatilis sp. TaxID=2569862 RepID=UPI0027360559
SAFPSLPTINPQLKPVRDNQMSGIINLPRHSSHPDCRARLIQIVALHLAFEPRKQRRRDTRPVLEIMQRVPPDRFWRPAVGAPLE